MFSAGVFASTQCLFVSKMRMAASPSPSSPQPQLHPSAFWEHWQRMVHPQQATYGRAFPSSSSSTAHRSDMTKNTDLKIFYWQCVKVFQVLLT